jgi:hypothetical protein
MGYVAEKVRWMVSEEAVHGWMVKGQQDPNEDMDTIAELERKYLWWTPTSEIFICNSI